MDPVGTLFTVGQVYKRRELHAKFGGQQQGGIATPSRYPIILLFTAERGAEYGYKDGWTDDGIFLYTGEGQYGDMQFTRGNRAVLEHVALGKDLHLFENIGKGLVRYIGRMVCIGYHERRGIDRNGTDRKIIVFELSPMETDSNAPAPLTEVSWDESLEELRKKALSSSTDSPTVKERQAIIRLRSNAIRLYALKRANGICEACGEPAPFVDKDGRPYLEVHHIRRLSDGGPEHPDWVAALCPNCHRRAHHGADARIFNSTIEKKVKAKEL